MKRIAIFNDFQLPVPATQGGAVQCLTETILAQNELTPRYCFDVFSPYDVQARTQAKKYQYSTFYYSRFANLIRLYTNVCFKLHIPLDLSAIMIAPDIKRIFQKKHYDAVYVNGYIRGVLSIAKLNQGRCPVYYHHHVVTDILNEKSIRGHELFETCEKIGFVSEYARQKALTGVVEYDKKVACFRNCIDTRKFQIAHKDEARATIRRKYGLKEDEVVVVYVGRFVANKGVLQLLKAFREVLRDGRSTKLMLIGGATYSSDKRTAYVEECLGMAQTMREHVILTGYIAHDKLPEYLAAADIGCVPSVCEEACGLTALEMMASGLPLLTTDAGGLKEYVPEGCKLVSPWEPGQSPDIIVKGLRDAIKRLIGDKYLRSCMGTRAQLAVQQYDVGTYLRLFTQFVDVLENQRQ